MMVTALRFCFCAAAVLYSLTACPVTLAGPTEDALKVGEEAQAKGEEDSALTTWVNAFNERAVANTANDETCALLLLKAGGLMLSQGKAPQAAGCFEKLYPLRAILNGPRAPETGIAASRLSESLSSSGQDFERAERLAREAVEILTAAGKEHVQERFVAMNNVGFALLAAKDRIAASKVFQENLDFARNEPGIKHDTIAVVYRNLAAIAAFFGRAADQMRHLRKQEEHMVKAFGRQAWQTFATRIEVAGAMPAAEKPQAFQAIVSDLYATPGSDTDKQLLKLWTLAEYRLAAAESQQGVDRARIISLMESAIKHGTAGYGELHTELLQLHLELAKLHLTRNNHQRGLECYRKVLAIRTKHLGPDHESTIQTKKMLDDLEADIARLKK